MSISLHVLMCHYNRSLHTVADGLPSTHRPSIHRPSVRPVPIHDDIEHCGSCSASSQELRAPSIPCALEAPAAPGVFRPGSGSIVATGKGLPSGFLSFDVCVCVFAHLMSSLHQGSLLSKPRCRPFPDASPLSDCVVCPRRSRRRAVSSGSIPPSSLPPSLPAALLCSAAISPGFRPSKPPSAFCWAAPGSDLS